MSKVRLGVMGGTFDPIHLGHISAAQQVAKQLGLDGVVFVPASAPWQKTTHASVLHRLEMTKLAISDYPNFSISTVDIDRPGPTYTVDTLSDLQSAHKDSELFFITGADSLNTIQSWKDFDLLWSMAKFVGVNRPGHSLEVPKSPPGAIALLDISALPISSTQIRAKVDAGESLAGLVPDAVADYIRDNNLYQGNK